MTSEERQTHAYLFFSHTWFEKKGQSALDSGRTEFRDAGSRDTTHTGANGVELCFSAASIRTAMQSAAVMNISMKTP